MLSAPGIVCPSDPMRSLSTAEVVPVLKYSAVGIVSDPSTTEPSTCPLIDALL